MTRREEVIVLLRSRTDWHQSLRSQFATFGALPGETATEWVLCRSCGGDGELRGRKGPELCGTCAGNGRYLVDSYTRKPAAELVGGKPFTGSEREQWRRLTDSSIARLRQQTQPPRTEADLIADTAPYPWERIRDRYYRSGDYRALDAALWWLASVNPPARSLIGWVYESGADTLGCLHPSIMSAAEIGVDVVAQKMPDPIRIPSWLLTTTPRRIQERRAA